MGDSTTVIVVQGGRRRPPPAARTARRIVTQAGGFPTDRHVHRRPRAREVVAVGPDELADALDGDHGRARGHATSTTAPAGASTWRR